MNNKIEDDKIDGRHWYNEIMKNNPHGEFPELNLKDWRYNKNNPLGYWGHPEYNPIDSEHPLWFEWCCLNERTRLIK